MKKNKDIEKLIEGYRQFKDKYFDRSEIFTRLVEDGQKPEALVIACCDSRVDPAILMNCDPGELFVVRNVANLVPAFEADHNYHHGTSAALEFGVRSLGVKNIIILGHSHCGGIKSLMENESKSNCDCDFIDTWMDIAKEAKEDTLKYHSNDTLKERMHQCEKKSLVISLNNLSTFPWIKERLLSGELCLHAWYFDLETGVLQTYDQTKDEFIKLIQ